MFTVLTRYSLKLNSSPPEGCDVFDREEIKTRGSRIEKQESRNGELWNIHELELAIRVLNKEQPCNEIIQLFVHVDVHSKAGTQCLQFGFLGLQGNIKTSQI